MTLDYSPLGNAGAVVYKPPSAKKLEKVKKKTAAVERSDIITMENVPDARVLYLRDALQDAISRNNFRNMEAMIDELMAVIMTSQQVQEISNEEFDWNLACFGSIITYF